MDHQDFITKNNMGERLLFSQKGDYPQTTQPSPEALKITELAGKLIEMKKKRPEFKLFIGGSEVVKPDELTQKMGIKIGPMVQELFDRAKHPQSNHNEDDLGMIIPSEYRIYDHDGVY